MKKEKMKCMFCGRETFYAYSDGIIYLYDFEKIPVNIDFLKLNIEGNKIHSCIWKKDGSSSGDDS